MKEERIDLTPKGLKEYTKHKLFALHEKADGLERIISKCDAVTNVLSEALERMKDCGTRPTDDRTIIDVVDVINEYSRCAKYGIRELEEDLSELHIYSRSKD